MWRKKDACTPLVGIEIRSATMEIRKKNSSKLKTELPYNLEIPLLDIHHRETETLTQKATSTPVFIAAVVIYNSWGMKTTKCSSVDDWVTWYVYAGVCMCMLFSHKEEETPAIFDNTDGPWEDYAKWNKSDKHTKTICSHKENLKKQQTKKHNWTHRYRRQIGGCPGQGVGGGHNWWRWLKGTNIQLWNK